MNFSILVKVRTTK